MTIDRGTATSDETALVERHVSVALMPIMDVPQALARLKQLQEFCASYLQESKDGGGDGGDYGVIPGAGKKKVLFKSGAEKLCDIYGLADRYQILTKVEDFDKGLFDYTIECELVRKADQMFVGSGLGAASSWEAKYRWRETRRVCPQCGNETIIKGKAEFGGGWVCWKTKGGCGAKFADTDPAITEQKIGRTENPDLIDSKNTVLKMAKKRAKIDAVIGVTRSSGIFTQDLSEHEYVDVPMPVTPEGGNMNAEPVKAKPSAPHVVGTEAPTPENDPAGRFTPSTTETHAEKIARVKAEAAAKQKPVAVTPAVKAEAAEMGEPDVTPEPDPTPVAGVRVSGVKPIQGPMVVKDGEQKPSWVLYVVTFTSKVRADNGVMVSDASTFDEKLAGKALDARDAKSVVTPKILPNEKKKGSFKLAAL